MKLLPIDVDENKNIDFLSDAECREVLAIYPGFYQRVGFHPPWIGYFFSKDGLIVGCGGYKGKPKNGKVEIAYGTFSAHERRGIGTEICRQLVNLASLTDQSIRITARTLPEHIASIGILKKNGFEFTGMVWDEEDGEVAEWEYARR